MTPSPKAERALICAVAAAILGPLAEVLIVEAELAMYAPSADGLIGVAEWLPALYFALNLKGATVATDFQNGTGRGVG